MSSKNRSKEALEVQHMVKGVIPGGKKIPYNREFLYRYQPNATQYIDPYKRSQLRFKGFMRNKSEDDIEQFVLNLAWNSSRLEGGTYSLIDTKRFLSMGAPPTNINDEEATILQNHKEAIQFLIGQAKCGRPLTAGFVLNLHALLSDNLLGDPSACGRLRSREVFLGISNYKPSSNQFVIKECFEQIINIANKIQDPFEASFFLMVHLPYLQPFEDVNKRVSRLVANFPLLSEGLAPITFTDVIVTDYLEAFLGVYEFNRIELLRDIFIEAYDSSTSLYRRALQTVAK